MQLDQQGRLLDFARELQRATSFLELLQITRDEVEREVGYRHVWLAVLDSADAKFCRVVDIESARRESILESAATIPIEGDAMLHEIFHEQRTVVVEDARTDPRTNKQIVEALQNRTLILVPLRILDKPFGGLGVGTFGDEEGCRPPTPEALAYLVAIANQVTVAASRLRFLEQSRVQERARRTLENRLAQMQRIESVGILAGGVAHDFNNLLTVILSGAALAMDEDDPNDRKRDLEIVIEAARRGQEVTRQLLAMSRARPLVTSTVEPDERIAALVPLLRRVIPEVVAIELHAGAAGERVEADPTQLDQVIMNLALNARDAMPEGGHLRIATRRVTIDEAFVSAHPWAVPGDYVEITVADDGTGMPPEVLERIFEPFFTTKGPRTGTGLGLTVALGIAKQHGGLLHCESAPARGTTFTIHWPVASRSGALASAASEGPLLGGSESLLVAEDDAAVAAVVRRILERAGYTVAVVPDGPTACATLATDAFDLAIFDVIMPGMSVTELVERAVELRPGLRILLASGYTAEAQVAELLREGKHTLLAKPFDPDQLLRAVRRRLDRA